MGRARGDHAEKTETMSRALLKSSNRHSACRRVRSHENKQGEHVMCNTSYTASSLCRTKNQKRTERASDKSNPPPAAFEAATEDIAVWGEWYTLIFIPRAAQKQKKTKKSMRRVYREIIKHKCFRPAKTTIGCPASSRESPL